jgi:hypothetical protein
MAAVVVLTATVCASATIRLVATGSVLVRWRWTHGPTTAKADFDDPTTDTDYALCLYDQTAGVWSLALEANAPAASTCSAKPCWIAKKAGFKYASEDGVPQGLVDLSINARSKIGQASISAKGVGPHLLLPALPLHEDPQVTVQLRDSAGGCWGADFSTAMKSDATQFRAKSE